MSSTLRTAALMGLLMSVVIFAFWVVGGRGYATFGLIFGALMNFGVYWYSDKIVLSMTRAKEVSSQEAPELHEIVEQLARKASIPKPRVYIINDPSLNAFATGRSPSHAAIAVHTGLIKACTKEELQGVLGHELTHIKNRDTIIQTAAAVIAGTLQYLVYAFMFGGRDREKRENPLALLALILTPIAAMLIQMAISRTREYSADEGGAMLSNPHYLASALRKISNSVKLNPKIDGNPATAHMYIMNPFGGMDIASLFSTHPPTEERIRRLERMR